MGGVGVQEAQRHGVGRVARAEASGEAAASTHEGCMLCRGRHD